MRGVVLNNNSKWKRIIPIITSIILSVITFIFGTFWDPFDYKTLSSIPAFLFSIVVLLIGQIISIQSEVDKVSDTSDIICDTVKSYIHVTKIGTPKKAWEYVIRRLPVMDYVQNTSFNYKDEIDQTEYRLYGSDIYQKSLREIASQVKKGLQWQDIGDSTAIERFRAITDLIPENIKGNYACRLISQTEPQLGFIILTYKDGTKEVLFNWDFRDIPQDPVVLLSRDEEIINMFAAQHRGLWRVSTEHYDTKVTKSTS